MSKIDSFLVEQNIISCILKKPSLIYDVSSSIDESYFTDNPNRKQNKALFLVFNYISRETDMDDLKFDSMTILSVTQKFDKVSKALQSIFPNKEDFVQYIEMLRESPIDPSNIDIHLDELKKINVANAMMGKVDRYQRNLQEKYKEWTQDEIINHIESEILEVSNKFNANQDKTFISANKDRLKRYKNYKPNENGFNGLPLPLDTVNKFSRGLLREGSVTVINAKTGVGKSLILKSTAKFLAIDNNIPVYLGANEMSPNEQEERLIKEMTGLPMLIIENHLYNSPKKYIRVDGKEYNVAKIKKEVLDAVQVIDESPIFFDRIIDYSPESLVQRAKYFKKRHGIKLFIWDYVKETSGSLGEDLQLRHWLAGVIETMKEQIADKLGIPVLTASQAKPYEYWLSNESYGIEKYCTAFCLLRELEREEQKGMGGEYAFTIKKNRFSRKHKDYKQQWIDLTLNEDTLAFEEVEF